AIGGLLLAGRAPVRVEPSYRKSVDPVAYEPNGGVPFVVSLRVVTDGATRTIGGGLSITDATTATLVLAARTGFVAFDRSFGSEEEIITQAMGESDAAARKTYEALRADHIAEHRRSFERVAIDLGATSAAERPTDERIRRFSAAADPELVSLLFQYGRYLL